MHALPDLPYKYDALGTYISKDIMELHHSKHHQTYVDKLNAALEQAPELKEMPLDELLRSIDSLPENIRQTIRNHGGGHYNHSMFWKFMIPDGKQEPGGELSQHLTEKHGSFQKFIDTFSQQGLRVFGSGWVWLQPDLSIITTPNQDSPIMSGGQEPLLGLDVWEHAYYLDYTYNRADYIHAWWHVVNWDEIQRRFAIANS